MSVRRLAEAGVQPQSFSFNRANAAWAKKKLKDYPKGRQASGVIPLLMRAQEQDGWVTKAAIEHVADMLDMPMIRVLEVATFYTQFQLAPVGKKAHIQVCGTTPCMLRGSEDLMKVCKSRIAEKPFELNAEGTLSWEEVECQGACVNAPMVMIFKDTYEDLTPERLEEIIDEFEAGKGGEVKPGPQIDRIYSAPEGGLTSLNDNSSLSKPKTPVAKAKTKTGVTSKKATKTASKTKAESVKPLGVAAVAAPKKSAAKATPKKPVAKKPTAKKTVAKAMDAGKPTAMKKPKQPDDLKMISGVGPKIEGILNSLGVYKFEQIGQWKKAERDWVDDYLSFKGRIERDEWVKQAKVLAKQVAKGAK